MLLFDQNLSSLEYLAQLRTDYCEIRGNSLVNPGENYSPWKALSHLVEIQHSAWILYGVSSEIKECTVLSIVKKICPSSTNATLSLVFIIIPLMREPPQELIRSFS